MHKLERARAVGHDIEHGHAPPLFDGTTEVSMQHIHRRMTSDTTPMDERSSDRFGIALPISMKGGEGETHDISETGLLFETDCEPQVGERIGMTLQYWIDGQEFKLGCELEVVRVERVGASVNVAGRLLSPLFSEQ